MKMINRIYTKANILPKYKIRKQKNSLCEIVPRRMKIFSRVRNTHKQSRPSNRLKTSFTQKKICVN